MRKLFILILFAFLFFPSNAYAASFNNSIQNQNATYQVNDEVTVRVVFDISANDGTFYYLQGLFYKTSGTYCGSTWNGSSFYNGSTSGDGFKQLNKIAISGNKWEGDIKLKIDTSDNDCKDTGEYKLKIRRFTEGGSDSIDEQNELTVNFNIPPTPTLTQAPTPVPPTPTTKPTNIPAPTSAPTATKTPTPRISPTSAIAEDEDATMEATMMRTMAADTGQQEGEVMGVDLGGELDELEGKENPYNWAKLLILMGAVLVTGACGILVYNNYLKDKLEEMRSQ